MPAKIDLTGMVFGRLTVLRQIRTPAWSIKPWYECRCECRTLIDVPASNLRTGNTKSCGCWKLEGLLKRSTIHGHARAKRQSREYIIWCHIIARCENKKTISFPRYGGRGIRMCKEWREDFTAFLRDVGPRPSPHHWIERVDNHGDYEPSNCVWATPIEQANNRRNNHRIAFNGQTQTLAQWSRETGLPLARLSARLLRGWSIHRAFTTPISQR